MADRLKILFVACRGEPQLNAASLPLSFVGCVRQGFTGDRMGGRSNGVGGSLSNGCSLTPGGLSLNESVVARADAWRLVVKRREGCPWWTSLSDLNLTRPTGAIEWRV